MNKPTFASTALLALLTVAFVAAPIASVEASNGDRGNHYGWYKHEWKKNKYENRGYFPFYGYGSTAGLEAYIKQLQDLLARLEAMQNGGSYATNINVTTRSAANIDEDSATLRGTIDVKDDEDARVYFEYGTSRTNLNKTSATEEYDEDTDFDISVGDLADDTIYYFRAVGKDEDGDKDYGAIMSFRTGNGETDDEPTVTTKAASDIEDTSAELNGTIAMNDFEDGRVFFIYGTDEDAIDDASSENEYSDITEDGDDLKKAEVDADLDGTSSYTLTVTNLEEDTTYYFRVAVEYDDEDDDSEIEFGSIRSFTTND